MNLRKSAYISGAVNLAIVLLVFCTLYTLISSGVLNRYQADLITLVCINVTMAVSLNLVTGVLGQLVLGHAGFMLAGAYAAALFTKSSSLPIQIALPIGMVLAGIVAAAFGVIIGIPALRLRGDYLAIITLGFGEIIRVIANNLNITGGAMGLSGISSLANRKNPAGMLPYVFFVAVLVIFMMFTFARSRHGRAVIAIREDEIAAEASGINTTYYKLLAFVLAAFIAGVAGGLYAHHLGLIDPSKYDFNRSVEFLIMVVLGGMGSITGSIVSASVLTLLPELLRGFSNYRMLVYSIVLICVMLFRPTGLLGRAEFSFSGLVAHLAKRRKAAKGGTQ